MMYVYIIKHLYNICIFIYVFIYISVIISIYIYIMCVCFEFHEIFVGDFTNIKNMDFMG